MPKLYIIRGVPGSGKSTYVRKNLLEHQWYEADMYFIRPDGRYEFNPRFIKDAHNWCRSKAHSAMAEGEDVVVSNTFTRKWEMKEYLRMAEDLGYTVEVIRCTGSYKNIHGVPDDKVQEMRNRFEDVEGQKIV